MVHPMARLKAVLGRAIGLAIVAALATPPAAVPQAGAVSAPSVHLTVPEQIGEMALATRVELPPIRAFELGLSASALAQPGAGGGSGMNRAVAEMHSLNLTVERELAGLWRLRVPAGMRLGSMRVSYQVVAGSGVLGHLSNAELPEEVIPVRIMDAVPIVVENDGESTVLEGGAALFLDLSIVRHSGRFVGAVQVTLDSL